MVWHCFFYGFDDWVHEREISGLEPDGVHREYYLRMYGGLDLEEMPIHPNGSLKIRNRIFRCVAAFRVNSKYIAYYQEC